MTVVAIIAASDVRRVLPRCRDAVMAGAAGAQYLCVVDRDCGLECDSTVTVLANIGRLHVGRTLAGGGGAIVATDAVPGDASVIEHRREPRGNVVAIITLII